MASAVSERSISALVVGPAEELELILPGEVPTEVDRAANPADAIFCLARKPYHLVLVDHTAAGDITEEQVAYMLCPYPNDRVLGSIARSGLALLFPDRRSGGALVPKFAHRDAPAASLWQKGTNGLNGICLFRLFVVAPASHTRKPHSNPRAMAR